jgi:hypothetical protein
VAEAEAVVLVGGFGMLVLVQAGQLRVAAGAQG